MFENLEQSILHFLTAFAYDPYAFYGFIILIMTLTTFGLPVSEEVVIISAALVAYMGAHPELYPPPVEALQTGQGPVRASTTALVCFLSVFLSDLLVYMMGFIFREKIIRHPVIKKHSSKKKKERIQAWVSRYGCLVAGMFRFTPGLRFIGYLTCGVVRIPIYKFTLVTGGVALAVIPAQVFIVSAYGETIIANLKLVSLALLILCSVFLFTMLSSHIYRLIKHTD